MKINIERGRLRQRTRSVRVLLSRISFVAARRLPQLPGRQTSNSIRHNQLSQSSKCKTNTSLQTFNKGRNTFFSWLRAPRAYLFRKETYQVILHPTNKISMDELIVVPKLIALLEGCQIWLYQSKVVQEVLADLRMRFYKYKRNT